MTSLEKDMVPPNAWYFSGMLMKKIMEHSKFIYVYSVGSNGASMLFQ